MYLFLTGRCKLDPRSHCNWLRPIHFHTHPPHPSIHPHTRTHTHTHTHSHSHLPARHRHQRTTPPPVIHCPSVPPDPRRLSCFKARWSIVSSADRHHQVHFPPVFSPSPGGSRNPLLTSPRRKALFPQSAPTLVFEIRISTLRGTNGDALSFQLSASEHLGCTIALRSPQPSLISTCFSTALPPHYPADCRFTHVVVLYRPWSKPQTLPSVHASLRRAIAFSSSSTLAFFSLVYHLAWSETLSAFQPTARNTWSTGTWPWTPLPLPQDPLSARFLSPTHPPT